MYQYKETEPILRHLKVTSYTRYKKNTALVNLPATYLCILLSISILLSFNRVIADESFKLPGGAVCQPKDFTVGLRPHNEFFLRGNIDIDGGPTHISLSGYKADDESAIIESLSIIPEEGSENWINVKNALKNKDLFHLMGKIKKVLRASGVVIEDNLVVLPQVRVDSESSSGVLRPGYISKNTYYIKPNGDAYAVRTGADGNLATGKDKLICNLDQDACNSSIPYIRIDELTEDRPRLVIADDDGYSPPVRPGGVPPPLPTSRNAPCPPPPAMKGNRMYPAMTGAANTFTRFGHINLTLAGAPQAVAEQIPYFAEGMTEGMSGEATPYSRANGGIMTWLVGDATYPSDIPKYWYYKLTGSKW